MLLGVFEVTAALLLAIKPVAPKLSIIGSLMAIVLFVSTHQLPVHHPRDR